MHLSVSTSITQLAISQVSISCVCGTFIVALFRLPGWLDLPETKMVPGQSPGQLAYLSLPCHGESKEDGSSAFSFRDNLIPCRYNPSYEGEIWASRQGREKQKESREMPVASAPRLSLWGIRT